MPATSFNLIDDHLEKVRRAFDASPALRWSARGYRRLLAHYYNLHLSSETRVLEIGCGTGALLRHLKTRHITGVDLSPIQIDEARRQLPHGHFHVLAAEHLVLRGTFDVVILSDTINHAADVQLLLQRLHAVCTPTTRLILNYHSNVWRPVLFLARILGLQRPEPPSNWLATADVQNLLALADWEPVSAEHRLLCPVPIPGLAPLLNRWFAPFLPFLCLTVFLVARPRRTAAPTPLTVSVVIPARNESGNIRAALVRTPEMGAGTELIFVEGHSRDDTWAQIERLAKENPQRRIKILRHSGRGKGDAVRAGFAAASGDILMILDADLTTPPEELTKFYDVIASGRAEFANGVRLVYPMEDRAMPFLNLCVNKTFGIIFSWLLGQPVKDTLCGTKVLSRRHYETIAANRGYFGDFDPFGDFDLLFGAAKLDLKIADVPIRYRERTYGSTNIRRWKHGALLLRMVAFAARKLKFV